MLSVKEIYNFYIKQEMKESADGWEEEMLEVAQKSKYKQIENKMELN